jgi:hypothetical protein
VNICSEPAGTIKLAFRRLNSLLVASLGLVASIREVTDGRIGGASKAFVYRALQGANANPISPAFMARATRKLKV